MLLKRGLLFIFAAGYSRYVFRILSQTLAHGISAAIRARSLHRLRRTIASPAELLRRVPSLPLDNCLCSRTSLSAGRVDGVDRLLCHSVLLRRLAWSIGSCIVMFSSAIRVLLDIPSRSHRTAMGIPAEFSARRLVVLIGFCPFALSLRGIVSPVCSV